MISFLRSIFDPRERLKRTLASGSLPALPAAHLRVLQALRSDCTLQEVGAEITLDPALTSAVLRTVNAAAFGLRRRVSDPAHAASLLGRAELETLVLGMGVIAASPTDPPGLSTTRFWRESARRAVTARILAERLCPRERTVCFTAGLLQDMALPLLCAARPKTYVPLVERYARSEDLAAAERESLGFDHAEVAGWLAEMWRFPEPLTEAIQKHHQAGEGLLPVVVVGMIDDEEDDEALVERIRGRVSVDPELLLEALALGREQGEELARALCR